MASGQRMCELKKQMPSTSLFLALWKKDLTLFQHLKSSRQLF